MTIQRTRGYIWLVYFILITSLLVSCTPDLGFLQLINPTPAVVNPVSAQETRLAMVTFEVINLQDSLRPENVTLEVLDEVTGLALNPQRYKMSRLSAGRYSAEIAIPVGSVIKYRYLRGEYPFVVEYTATGLQTRYRMYHVTSPGIVQDIVPAWTDLRYSGPTGRIKGQVINPDNNTPIPSALIIAGGFQTLTASDGTFLLEGLPPGVHNLVVYSLDGSFETFQQGALVAEQSTTPALIFTRPSPQVNVTFVVQAPESNIKGLPVRMVGNLYQLGNTFADLEGGVSVVAARAPMMTQVSEGFYSITLKLPVGFDLRYKYTLGDGLWNAEHHSDGGFVTRQLVVPANDTTITDTIQTWKSGDFEPITFLVTVPENTPIEDTVSIQFNPYGWTSPIPMWPVGGSRWLFALYSPLNMVGTVSYRYCRNDQCGISDGQVQSAGDGNTLSFTPGSEAQIIQDTVLSWSAWDPAQGSTAVEIPEISHRGDSFMAGVEISSEYKPLWQPYQFWGLNKINLLGANWAVITPTWAYTRSNPPVIEPIPGKTPLWFDTTQTIQTARQNNLTAALFPRLDDSYLQGRLWEEPVDDPAWWQNWYERYRIFILNYADLATQTSTPLLILGGRDVSPALPDGLLPDGRPSGAPDYAAQEWPDILQAIRARYTGKIAWALPYPLDSDRIPVWIEDVDMLYILVSMPLTGDDSLSHEALVNQFAAALDEDIFPLYQRSPKPVVIALNYPATQGALQGCIKVSDSCLDFEELAGSLQAIPAAREDLQTQAAIYQAALTAISERDWISGVVARGFYTPVAIQDRSTSVHGKPASSVIWGWYPKILGR